MPLNIAALQSGIRDVAANPPDSVLLCAQAWADAMKTYAAGSIPASTTVEAAAAALTSALTSAFGSPSAGPAMDVAFTTFATTVGTGMAAAGFAAVPPATPIGFASQFSGPKPETHDQAASQYASLIDAWFRTGIATLIAPPNTPTPWT